jgi:putative ribosome biogenesis GTPase RsgA
MITLPYPGLRSFEEADGPIFFGRQAQIASLLRRLEKNRFVAVIGSSGSGKSSLVRAKLLPAIYIRAVSPGTPQVARLD